MGQVTEGLLRKSEFFCSHEFCPRTYQLHSPGKCSDFPSDLSLPISRYSGCNDATSSLSGQRVFERAGLEDSLCGVRARDLHVPHREDPGAGAEGRPPRACVGSSGCCCQVRWAGAGARLQSGGPRAALSLSIAPQGYFRYVTPTGQPRG